MGMKVLDALAGSIEALHRNRDEILTMGGSPAEIGRALAVVTAELRKSVELSLKLGELQTQWQAAMMQDLIAHATRKGKTVIIPESDVERYL